MQAAFDSSAATGTDLLVLLILANHANDSGEAWPSVARVARVARVSVSTARRSIRTLERLGEVQTVVSPGRPNRYRLTLADPGQIDRPSLDATGADPGQIDRPTPVRLTDTPVTGDRGPRSWVTAEPSMNRQETSTRAQAPDARAEGFDEAWAVYPRKIGREAARRKYAATLRKGASAADLLTAARNYASACAGTDTRFVKHGATFFGRDEPWRDYLTAGPEPPAERATIADEVGYGGW